MRRTIYDMDWESLLPEPLYSDKRIFATAKAIAEQKRKISAAIWNARVWLEIDNLPERILDLLAYDLDIKWYSGDYTLETKRNILKSAFQVYKTLGTTGAVKRALKDIYENAEVYEWFQYGGEPYRFRVLIDTTPMRENLSHRQIIEAIETYKPLRAWADYVAYMQRAGIGISVSRKVYYLDYEMCGTQPDISTGLGINREGVNAQWRGNAYRTLYTPASEDQYAGTEPGISTGFSVERSGILSGVQGAGFGTDYAMCGDDMP